MLSVLQWKARYVPCHPGSSYWITKKKEESHVGGYMGSLEKLGGGGKRGMNMTKYIVYMYKILNNR